MFHNKYSVSNTLLILSQRPDATLVAGKQQWSEIGTKVKDVISSLYTNQDQGNLIFSKMLKDLSNSLLSRSHKF